MTHSLFIKCMQLAALSHVKSTGRGAYVHAAKKTFFYKGCDQCYCVSATVYTEWGLVVI